MRMGGIQPCAKRACNWRRDRVIVEDMVKGVPGWFQVMAYVLAVGFCVWIGLHLRTPNPLPCAAIYTVAAIVSALLPSHRAVGFVGLVLGIAIGGWGTYLLRDVFPTLQPEDLLATTGGREVIALSLAGVWLVLGSAFRTQRA
jgi:hypothetical protein